MIRLVHPRELNALAAHPAIRPKLGPGNLTDLTWVYDEGGIALAWGDTPGCMVLTLIDKGIFEGHFLFPPESWGGPALAACEHIRDWLFTGTPLQAIHGKTPRDNRVALAFAVKLGCVPQGTTIDDAGIDCIHTVLTRERWVQYLASLKSRAALARTAPLTRSEESTRPLPNKA